MTRRFPAADVEVIERRKDGLPAKVRIVGGTLSRPVPLLSADGSRIGTVRCDGSVDWSGRDLTGGTVDDFTARVSARVALGRYGSTLKAPLNDEGTVSGVVALDVDTARGADDRSDGPGSREIRFSVQLGRILSVGGRPPRRR